MAGVMTGTRQLRKQDSKTANSAKRIRCRCGGKTQPRPNPQGRDVRQVCMRCGRAYTSQKLG